ncbi:hypothetical protein OY671_009776, partial [Metschnikowia pulcherrima]
ACFRATVVLRNLFTPPSHASMAGGTQERTRVAFPGWGWLGWSSAMSALIVAGGGTALASASRTNAVA